LAIFNAILFRFAWKAVAGLNSLQFAHVCHMSTFLGHFP